MEDRRFLDTSYDLETGRQTLNHYEEWAETYDQEVDVENAYAQPTRCATALTSVVEPGGRILDVGCGTGLVGAALRTTGPWTVDGLDLSAEMLGEARIKVAGEGDPVYRHLHEGDLTATLDIPSGAYGAVVSSGTFTHGHVGPTAFDELYRITRPGGLFAIGINPDHFTNLGFADRFVDDVAAGRITEPVIRRVNTYEAGDHAGQLSPVAVFRTL